MTAIRIVKKIESETLTLPELRSFLGQQVEITVTETAAAAVEDRWKPLFDIAGKDLIDPEAYKEQREYDRLHE